MIHSQSGITGFILATDRFFGKFGGRHAAQCRMGTTLVIVYAPCLDFAQCILQKHEPVLVQTFLPQSAIEGLNSSVVHRCSGREKSILVSLSYIHLFSIFPANSEPLSVFSNCGKGRLSAILFSISATSVEPKFCPSQILGIRGCKGR